MARLGYMKQLALALALAFGFGLLAVAQQQDPQKGAQQQDPQKGAQQQGRDAPTRPGAQEEGTGDLDRFLQEYDQNSDQAIQKDELPQRLQGDFDRLDRNKDGKLTREELQQHARRMQQRCEQCEVVFMLIHRAPQDKLSMQDLQEAYQTLRTLDANNDGKLEREEIQQGREKVIKERISSRMQEWDTNKDGRISQDEARGPLRRRFEQLDRNRDKFLDQNELQQAFFPQGGEGEDAEEAEQPGRINAPGQQQQQQQNRPGTNPNNR